MLKNIYKFYTDILVIGGGTAGPMAALKAKEKNPEANITIVEKSTLRRGGSICRGMDAFNNVVVPGYGTVEDYVESIKIMADGIVDLNINRVLAEKSFEILKEIEDKRIATFPKTDNGEYMIQAFHPKGKFLAEMRGDIKAAFEKLIKEKDIKVLERTVATKIFAQNGKVAGATLFNYRTGEFMVCEAKTIIVCTGSQGRFAIPDTGFMYGTFDCPYNAGEGYVMLYEAGAELRCMEYLSSSPMTKDYEGPAHSTFIRHGAYLVNGKEERFLKHYAPDLMERCPNGIRERSIKTEIAEGRGPIYYDLRHLPEEKMQIIEEGLFSTERPTQKEFFELRNINFRKDLVELTMAGPLLCGGHGLAGAVIDENGQTTVQGLYAAGDVTSVGWGFVGGAWVFGKLAGEHAAEKIKNTEYTICNQDEVEKEYQRLSDAFNRESGIDPSQLEFKARNLIKPYLGSPKSETKLNYLLNKLENIKEDISKLVAQDYHYVLKVLEVESIVKTIEIAAKASLYRTESRWGYGHYRTDFPQKDSQWDGQFVIVKKGSNDEIVITKKEVS